MSHVHDYLRNNIAKSVRFFSGSAPGDRLVFAQGWAVGGDGWRSKRHSMEPLLTLPKVYSAEFYRDNSFLMGVEMVRERRVEAEYHCECLDDDFCPPICYRPGSGYNAAMHTGSDLVFERGPGANATNYILKEPIEELERFDTAFDLDNPWTHYMLDFWRGVETQDLEGLVVCPGMVKSPLDLANALRGNQLFYDLYDEPELVAALLNKCADSTIEHDRLMRSEIRCLREHTGGAMGLAFGSQTMLFNGDPVDLISDEMGRAFNTPSMEIVTAYAPSTVMHHHSIGVSRARQISEIKGLTLQHMNQDPNGPRLPQSISDEVIEASLKMPILLEIELNDAKHDFDGFMDRISQGRFVLGIYAESAESARPFIEKIRK